MLRIASRLLPALLLVGSCSSVYEIEFHVTLAEDVAVPPGVFIGFAIVEREAVDQTSARTQVAVTQGVRAYKGKGSVCCAPDPTVSLHAFIDLDGDRLLDPDEPRGADPKNPVTLTDSSISYRSSIVITRPPDPPAP